MRHWNMLISLLVMCVSFLVGCSPTSKTDSTLYDETYPQLDFRFSAMSSSLYHNLFVIDEYSRLWADGRNTFCQLGDAASSCSNISNLALTSLVGVKQVASGNYHTAILLNDGTVRLLGDSARGQLGIVPPVNSTTDAEGATLDSSLNRIKTYIQPYIQGGVKIKKVATGHYGTVLLDENGEIHGTGYYYNGQLAIPFDNAWISTTTYKTNFIKLTMPAEVKFTDITYGYDHVLAIDNNGKIWATGGNRFGQTGVGASTDDDVYGFKPAVLDNSTGDEFFIAVVAGGAGGGNGTDTYNGPRHSLALDSDGNIWATGANSKGQLGLDNLTNQNIFIKTQKPKGVSKFVKIAAGSSFSAALDDRGQIWMTGSNTYWTLSLGSMEYVKKWTKVQNPKGVDSFIDIAAGFKNFGAIDSRGRLWTCGTNDYGQLALGLIKDANVMRKYLSTLGENKEVITASSKDIALKADNLDVIVPRDENVFRVAFVGNSLTFTYDVPAKVAEIAAATEPSLPAGHFLKGKKVETAYFAMSGDDLNNQFNYRTLDALRMVAYYRPDIILFQEQTGSSDGSGRDINVIGRWKAFATSFGAEPMIYQRWYNGNDCLTYDAQVFSDGLNIRLAPTGHAFMYMVRPDNAACTPSGQTSLFKGSTRVNKTGDYHQNVAGAYLAASTIYSTIAQVDNTTIQKPPQATQIDGKMWDNLTRASTEATKHVKNVLNSNRSTTRDYKTNPNNIALDYDMGIISKQPISKTFPIGVYQAANIRFETLERAKFNLEFSGDDNASIYWFLVESNGRIIGRSGPAAAWPDASVTGCVFGVNNFKFSTRYECYDNMTLSEAFFDLGDRVAEYGVAYPDAILPIGTYVLKMIEAVGKNPTVTISINQE